MAQCRNVSFLYHLIVFAGLVRAHSAATAPSSGRGHLRAARASARNASAFAAASEPKVWIKGDIASGDFCAYDVPWVEGAGPDDENVMSIIRQAYGDEASLAHLGDGNVTSTASRLGPRGPRKCGKVDADGNCDVATCTEDTYGEITQRGAAQLFADPHVQLKPGNVFFDLGSGLGKLVADAALLAGAKATGVELSSLRFGLGCDALAVVAEESWVRANSSSAHGSVQTRRLEMRNDDMLKTDLRAADVVYVASLCFRPALMAQLQTHLVRHLKPGARVASLRRFPEVSPGAGDRTRLAFSAKLRVMMSWNDPDDPNPVFVYEAKKL